MKYIEAIENKMIQKYGFEAKATVVVFHITELARKLMK